MRKLEIINARIVVDKNLAWLLRCQHLSKARDEIVEVMERNKNQSMSRSYGR